MILVTGATGFLGKRVCRKLDDGQKEYVATSLSLGTDLRDKVQCDCLFDKLRPEYVLHCASYVGGIQFGMKYPADIFDHNLAMISNVFASSAKYKVKRLINPISNCAYPGASNLFKEDEFWDGPLHDSVMVYGMVRKMSLVGSIAYNKQYGLDTINLILSNMYGPEDHFDEERSHALGALLMKIVNAKKSQADSVIVWGTGTPVREWLYVDDGAEAMIRACGISPYNDIINIGISKGISIKDMAESIKKLVGYEGDLVYDASKPDGDPYKTVDGTLGEKLLGWRPEMDFETGLRNTIAWYLNEKA